MTIDSVEFSMLLEGYADSRQPECQALRKELVEHIDAHCEQQVAAVINKENT